MKKIAPGTHQQLIVDTLFKQIRAGEYQNGEKLPSLRRLGKRYGVSHETVKQALEHLRDRGILEIIPSNGAFVRIGREDGLSVQTNIIAVILDVGLPDYNPALTEPLYERFFTLSSRELSRFSYNQITLDICFDREEDRVNLQRTVEKVDGIITISLNSSHFMEYLENCGKPCVNLLPALEARAFDSVGIDEYNTYYNCAKEIIAQGYQKIAYCDVPVDQRSYYNRKNGILSACLDSGLAFDPRNLVHSRSWGFEYYYNAVSGWLETGPDADILITANDNLAISALKAFNEKGVKVPDDIALLGAKNTSHCFSTTPLLSSIDYHYSLLISHAIDRLLARIEKRTPNPEPVNLSFLGSLISRESV